MVHDALCDCASTNHPTEQHGCSRQTLQGDSGHDQPDEEDTDARHELQILLINRR